MDRLIVRELCQGSTRNFAWPDFRLSARAIGRKLGIPSGTVHNRLTTWTRIGFLKGAALLVNPSLFNLQPGMLALDASPSISKSELIERLSMVEHMFVINLHVGNFIGLAFYYGSEEFLRRERDLICKLCGTRDSKFAKYFVPACSARLSATDWRIISRLQDDVTEPYSEMAEALRVSTRTVKRRVDRMVRESAISGIALTDVTTIKNDMFAWLTVEYSHPEAKSRVDESLFAEIGAYLWMASIGDSYSSFLLNLPNAKSSTEIGERVRRLEGMKSTRIDILEERVEFPDVLAERVKEKMREVNAPGAKSSR